MHDLTLPVDDQSKHVTLQDDSQKASTFIEIEKESVYIIEPDSNDEETIRKEGLQENIRKVHNKDLIEESKKDTKVENRSNVDYKRNGLYGFFNNEQSQPNQPATWVQFQGGREIPPDGREPLYYDPHSRNSFVMLVFFIVFVMLLSTIGFNVVVYMIPEIKHFYLRMGFIIAIPAMILIVALSYAMTCLSCARQVPCNYICLLLAVIGMSNICAFITVRYNTSLILYAVIATTVVVFVCLLLACSRFDFTQWMLYVVVISVAFGAIVLIVSLTTLLTGTYFKTLHLIILIVGTILNVIMLTIELQTILGGKAIELSEDDYALGAFLLYTSIVDVFLKMLQIFGLCGDLN